MPPHSASDDTTASWSDHSSSSTHTQAESRSHRRTNRSCARSASQNTAHQTLPAPKPAYTYASMIAQAIMKDPDQIAPVHDIYRYVKVQYPKLCQGSDNPNKWRDTTRHTLTMNRGFAKATILSQQGMRRSGWVIKAEYLNCYVNGVFKLPKRRNTTPKSRQFAAYHPQQTRPSRKCMDTTTSPPTPTFLTASGESSEIAGVTEPQPTFLDASTPVTMSISSPSTASAVSCESGMPADPWHYEFPPLDAGSCSTQASGQHEPLWQQPPYATTATGYHDANAHTGGDEYCPPYTAYVSGWCDGPLGHGYHRSEALVALPAPTGAFATTAAVACTRNAWGQDWSKLDLLAYVATL
ncbi:hypothetical protein H4R35_003878 [Dimargaris xerosporica]|nr:hypothetical protein H4R35_003878 [Dimargaris xerosporica]